MIKIIEKIRKRAKEKINETKEIVCNVKEKIRHNIKSGNLKKLNKQNIKYYSILLLMVLLSIVTTYVNIKSYQEVNSENYIQYEIKEDTNIDTEVLSKYVVHEENIEAIQKSVPSVIETNYKLEESSIMTLNEKVGLGYPVAGKILREYSIDKVVYYAGIGLWKIHPGVDIVSDNNVNVVAVADGIVSEIYEDSSFGKCVEIQGAEYIYVYKSLDNIKIDSKQQVKQGQKIAETGECIAEKDFGAHVHIEVKKRG